MGMRCIQIGTSTSLSNDQSTLPGYDSQDNDSIKAVKSRTFIS